MSPNAVDSWDDSVWAEMWEEVEAERKREDERREAGLHILSHPYHPNGGQRTLCDTHLDAGVDAWDVSDLYYDMDDCHKPVLVCPECCMELETLFLRFLTPKGRDG